MISPDCCSRVSYTLVWNIPAGIWRNPIIMSRSSWQLMFNSVPNLMFCIMEMKVRNATYTCPTHEAPCMSVKAALLFCLLWEGVGVLCKKIAKPDSFHLPCPETVLLVITLQACNMQNMMSVCGKFDHECDGEEQESASIWCWDSERILSPVNLRQNIIINSTLTERKSKNAMQCKTCNKNKGKQKILSEVRNTIWFALALYAVADSNGVL